MLYNAKALKGYRLNSLDGEIGTVKEFYFDDRHWTVRYLVANTGHWLPGRLVLISPYALGPVNPDIYLKQIEVHLRKKQIEDSPSLESDKPVSHQFEQAYYGHYGWPVYWGSPDRWGPSPQIVRDREKWKQYVQTEKRGDPHLRSTHAVSGHHVEASDGEIGHVADFLIEDETWAIRYLVVDTHNWWPGKKVLISPQWITRVSWSERKVSVNLPREVIKKSPPYTPDFMLKRDYEEALHQHYGRQGYWVEEFTPSLGPEPGQ